MGRLTVDQQKCKGDGICVEICPKDVLELRDHKARAIEGLEAHCLQCGQCVAVCPHEALELEGLAPSCLERLGDWNVPFDRLLGFLHARRSVRVFANKPVDQAQIRRVLEAAAAAPPAFPPPTTEVLVVDRQEDLERLWRTCIEGYDRLLKTWSNPMGRLLIRCKRDAETVATLRSHVIPIVRWDNQRAREKGIDGYTYGAPVVMLFHADRWRPAYAENALIAATYAMLGAHAAGLGATLLSIVPPLLNHLAHDLKQSYGIPKDNRVVIALALGNPKYKYHRAVKRELRAVRFLSGQRQ